MGEYIREDGTALEPLNAGAQTIQSLKVENYKGVRGTVEINPEGKSLVVIAGPNGAGKSSFIDAIAEIFDPKGVRLTPKPIHEGESEASAELVTTEARIVRTWKKDDAGTLAAYALDGAKYPSGKAFVTEATGGAIFDAKEFVSLDEKSQRAQLLSLVELPFDLDELEAQRKAAFDGRTDVSREVKRLTSVRDDLPKPAPGVPAELESSSAIVAELEAAHAVNQDRSHTEQKRDAQFALVADLTAQLAQARERLTELEEDFQCLPAEVDTVALKARLDAVEQTNDMVRAARKWHAADADLNAESEKQAVLTAKLEQIERTKRDGLAAADFGALLPGISVDDAGVTVDGVPFRQVNTAEQIVIAFILLTVQRPDIRLVMIKDGDSLDARTLDRIASIASDRGYVVLCERDRDESRSIASAVFSEGVAS